MDPYIYNYDISNLIKLQFPSSGCCLGWLEYSGAWASWRISLRTIRYAWDNASLLAESPVRQHVSTHLPARCRHEIGLGEPLLVSLITRVLEQLRVLDVEAAPSLAKAKSLRYLE